MSAKMAHPQVSEIVVEGKVVGWRTVCARCGDGVTFSKGDEFWKTGVATHRPDDTAVCESCWTKMARRHRRYSGLTPGNVERPPDAKHPKGRPEEE